MNVEPDITTIAYNNRLLEEYLAYGEGYLYKCDSIQVNTTYFFSSVERDITKRVIIDYISI